MVAAVEQAEEAGRDRRCLVTGKTGPAEHMIRFVVGPEGRIVPDIAARLPGRGYWVTASRAAVDEAVQKKLFERAVARAGAAGDEKISVDERLGQQVADLLTKSALALLGLAKRAGLVLTGFEKVKAALAEGSDTFLVTAADGSPDGRRKLVRSERKVIDLFDRTQLSLALGRENVVHAALIPEGVGARFIAEARRLAAYREVKKADREGTADGSGGTTAKGPRRLRAKLDRARMNRASTNE